MDPQSAISLLAIIGPIGGAAISAVVSLLIFVIRDDRKEKKKRALELLEKFMTDESSVKARLVTQEYLIESGPKYNKYSGLNFEQLDVRLAASQDPRDNDARFMIRAVTSFFWLVDQARQHGQILESEKIFTEMYTWYWEFVIKHRIDGVRDDMRQFKRFAWMLSDQGLLENTIKQRKQMLASLQDANRLQPGSTGRKSPEAVAET